MLCLRVSRTATFSPLARSQQLFLERTQYQVPSICSSTQWTFALATTSTLRAKIHQIRSLWLSSVWSLCLCFRMCVKRSLPVFPVVICNKSSTALKILCFYRLSSLRLQSAICSALLCLMRLDGSAPVRL